jgi:hypothetical protein
MLIAAHLLLASKPLQAQVQVQPVATFAWYKMVITGGVQMSDNSGNLLPPEQFWNKEVDPATRLTGDGSIISNDGAAVQGTTVTVNASFVIPAGGYHGTLNTSATYWGQPVNCTPSTVSCDGNAGAGVTFTVTVGPLPAHVSVSEPLTISFSGSYNGINYKSDSTCSVYLVFQAPVAPQVAPWLQVVYDGCDWANGDTTADQVARDLTLGLYDAGYFNYTFLSSFTTPMSRSVFNLSAFLKATPSSSGNCVDVSDYLSITAAAQGLGFQVQEFAAYPRTSDDSFYTNSINPIGWPGYSSIKWQYHQVALFNGNVFDACAAYMYNLTGDRYKLPAYQWPLAAWWATPQPSGGGTYSYGVVAKPLTIMGTNTPDPTPSFLWVIGSYVPAVK